MFTQSALVTEITKLDRFALRLSKNVTDLDALVHIVEVEIRLLQRRYEPQPRGIEFLLQPVDFTLRHLALQSELPWERNLLAKSIHCTLERIGHRHALIP